MATSGVDLLVALEFILICVEKKKKPTKIGSSFAKWIAQCCPTQHWLTQDVPQISPNSRFRDKQHFSVMLYNIIAGKKRISAMFFKVIHCFSCVFLRTKRCLKCSALMTYDGWSVCPVVQLLDYFGSRVRQGIKGDEVVTLNDLEIRDTVSIPATPLASFHQGLLCPTFSFNQY